MIPRVWLQTCMFTATLLGPALMAQELPRVMIQTAVGSMEVEIDSAGSPDLAANFLRNIDHGAYRHGRFHRAVRADDQDRREAEIEVIAGGVNPSRSKQARPMALKPKKETGLSLGDDAVSVPAGGPDPSTAEFSIRVGNPPELGRLERDGRSFIAFGRVVRGTEVVRLIHTARAQDERLRPPIEIVNISRVE